MLVQVYTCQHVKLLEILRCGLYDFYDSHIRQVLPCKQSIMEIRISWGVFIQ